MVACWWASEGGWVGWLEGGGASVEEADVGWASASSKRSKQASVSTRDRRTEEGQLEEKTDRPKDPRGSGCQATKERLWYDPSPSLSSSAGRPSDPLRARRPSRRCRLLPRSRWLDATLEGPTYLVDEESFCSRARKGVCQTASLVDGRSRDTRAGRVRWKGGVSA